MTLAIDIVPTYEQSALPTGSTSAISIGKNGEGPFLGVGTPLMVCTGRMLLGRAAVMRVQGSAQRRQRPAAHAWFLTPALTAGHRLFRN